MIRITSGEFRGRNLLTPIGLKTRPTRARLRQALFNSIQGPVVDAQVLDLFSGSGALGFEALSRGAEYVVFIENDRRVVEIIQKNAQSLGVESKCKFINQDIQTWIKETPVRKFDIILADPPYDGDWVKFMTEKVDWNKLLTESGLLLLEWDPKKSKLKELSTHPFLVKIREKNYGDSVLTTFSLAGPVQADEDKNQTKEKSESNLSGFI